MLSSCNWILRSEGHAISYIAPSSSAVQRHPRPLNTAVLAGCDAMIVAGLARRSAVNNDRMFMDVCAHVGAAVAAGGCALLPSHPFGVVFDLLEAIHVHLNNMQVHTVPIYFISPVAKSSIAYANIFGTWLCSTKAERLDLPEWPFSHHQMIAGSGLMHFEVLEIEESSSTIFTPPPRLFFQT